MMEATIPLEAAGFADVPGFGAWAMCAYLVLMGVLAIAAGTFITRFLLVPERPPRH
jgi:hypothetical protein